MSEPNDEPLIPVFIPTLITLLAHGERQKGTPLTEAEVLAIRGRGMCMMMRQSMAIAMAEERGYADIDPEFAWEGWQEIRESLAGEGDDGHEPDAPRTP